MFPFDDVTMHVNILNCDAVKLQDSQIILNLHLVVSKFREIWGPFDKHAWT